VIAAVALVALAPASLPAWWSAFLKAPALESAFVQESESAVFGSLKRQGRLSVARGGRLRVAYDGGLLLVSDGRALVQYDPDARTAQRFDLRTAQSEVPLLGLLLDPGGLPLQFEILPMGGGKVRLKPKRAGNPVVELEGQGASPTLIRWVDASGATQVLRLTAPRAPSSSPASQFRFDPPAGTRWVGGR
jgi:outer membrane lipoprotein-sorting protein